MRRVTVAGISIELHGCEDMHHADKLALFPYNGDGIDQRITVEWLDELTIPDKTSLGTAGHAAWWQLKDDLFVMAHRERQVTMTYTADFSEVRIGLRRNADNRAPHLYFYVVQAVAYRMLTKGGALLHSAGLSVFGGGVALAGASGVGKSTMAAHCLAIEPSANVLCEDTPAVVCCDDGYALCGTPFCGDDDACSVAEAPLRAIVFLKQAPVNRLVTANPKEALFGFMQTIVKPYYHDELDKTAVQTALDWIKTVPVYIFENDGTKAAAETLLYALTEDGVFKERTSAI